MLWALWQKALQVNRIQNWVSVRSHIYTYYSRRHTGLRSGFHEARPPADKPALPAKNAFISQKIKCRTVRYKSLHETGSRSTYIAGAPLSPDEPIQWPVIGRPRRASNKLVGEARGTDDPSISGRRHADRGDEQVWVARRPSPAAMTAATMRRLMARCRPMLTRIDITNFAWHFSLHGKELSTGVATFSPSAAAGLRIEADEVRCINWINGEFKSIIVSSCADVFALTVSQRRKSREPFVRARRQWRDRRQHSTQTALSSPARSRSPYGSVARSGS